MMGLSQRERERGHLDTLEKFFRLFQVSATGFRGGTDYASFMAALSVLEMLATSDRTSSRLNGFGMK